MKYIIALDQGTTSSRAVLFDENCRLVGMAQKEFTQIYPKPGWVEHDPEEIWRAQREVLLEVMRTYQLEKNDVLAIGITNQRETTVVWDRNTGEPVFNAIVWQDRRTADICEAMKSDGLETHVRQNTGLVVDAYFSGTKLAWILRNVPGARQKAERGELAFGTIDTWLIWKLTNGQVHATDYTNASRTLLYDIQHLKWDERLLAYLDIPSNLLPEVAASGHHFGQATWQGLNIPIYSVLGDQQAALFGQACFEDGMAKNTYGTGCFLLMNTGQNMPHSQSGLISTIAWGDPAGAVHYALEGSVFIAGAAMQWLRDGLKIIDDVKDSAYFASKVGEEDEEVYLVPAFVGLGAPYWDMYARGAIFGLTRGTGKNHFIKAALRSLAYQSRDVLEAMEKDSGLTLKSLKVDGGAAGNNLLMQFQADILDAPVERPKMIESTAFGAAAMAGIKAGIWDQATIVDNRVVDALFQPDMPEERRNKLYGGWKNAVSRTVGWLKG